MQGPQKPRGVWQFAAFALALLLALFVWGFFPEPEESRRGYTPKGCYDSGRVYFNDARRLKGPAHDYPRSERYLTAVRYFEALERRFGIGRARWDAYEMLADAKHELALAGEAKPMLRERFGLDAPRTLRNEALRACRKALLRVDEDSPKRPVLLRKQAEILVELGGLAELDEALEILRALVKLYRQSKVDSLRRERGEGLAFVAPGAAAPEERAAELAEEARAVYFLAGRGAAAASDLHLAAAREATSEKAREEELLLGAARSEEATRDFKLFVEAGGAGDRRVAAEKTLGDLAFRRARRLEGDERHRVLEEARTHYGAAGTRETAFLLARVLFGLGEHDDASSRFAHRKGAPPAEARARAYMRARCDLASGDLDGAKEGFEDVSSKHAETAEGFAALAGLAWIALAEGRLESAAQYLSRVIEAGPPAAGSVDLPERDGELGPARLAEMLTSVAREFDGRGEFDRTIELYRAAAPLDPGGPERSLRLVARALEKKAGAARDPEERRLALEEAAETYVGLAKHLPPGRARREAERLAAERFNEGGLYSRAIEVARAYVVCHPADRFTSRVLHDLADWESKLGLGAEAEEHFGENFERHPTDVYADRSRLELAKLLAACATDEKLGEAARALGDIVVSERYGRDSLVRLEALFRLGSTQLRRAERVALAGGDPAVARALFGEAAKSLEEALAREEKEFPPEGPNARPLFAKLIAEERGAAVEALAAARTRLARLEGEFRPARPVTPEELDRRWQEISSEISSFPAALAGAGEAVPPGSRKD